MNSKSLNASRALDILIVLGEAGRDGLSLARITQEVGGAKSAVHRSLGSLLQKGFVETTGRYGSYRLGPAIALLARTQVDLEKQIQQYRPGMTEFARMTGFTVYLIVQAGVDALCAELVSRSVERQLSMGVGARVPMGIGAGSLALLAMLTDEAAEAIIEANAVRYTHTAALRHLDKDVIKTKRQLALERGYAINMGYYLPGAGGLAIAIPAKNYHNVNVAISFNAPLEMMTDSWMDQIMSELRACIGEIPPMP